MLRFVGTDVNYGEFIEKGLAEAPENPLFRNMRGIKAVRQYATESSGELKTVCKRNGLSFGKPFSTKVNTYTPIEFQLFRTKQIVGYFTQDEKGYQVFIDESFTIE